MKKTNLKSILLIAIAALIQFSCQKETEVKVTNMSIKSMPAKTEYYVGEYLDLSGLEVTLSKDDGSTEDVVFEDFEENGIMCHQNNELFTVIPKELIIIHLKTNIKVKELLTTKSITDIDNNSYPIAKFGDQIWMAANLKTTKYQNGDVIGTTDPIDKDIWGEIAPSYQWDATVGPKGMDSYGRYYTWYAATDKRNICPAGWHIPSKNEVETLIEYLGGEVAAGKMYIDLGYMSYLAGGRITNGQAPQAGQRGIWWMLEEYSQENACIKMWNSMEKELFIKATSKNNGGSVFCIKD